LTPTLLSFFSASSSWTGYGTFRWERKKFFRVSPDSAPDIDGTVDRACGGQQLSLFNAHAGGACSRSAFAKREAAEQPMPAGMLQRIAARGP